MSSVLKALKRLDEEKRAGESAPSSPASQRWASGGQPERKRRPWLLLGAGLATLLLIVLVVLWSARRPAPVVSAPLTPPPVAPVIDQPPAVQPVVSAPPAPERIAPVPVGRPPAPVPQVAPLEPPRRAVSPPAPAPVVAQPSPVVAPAPLAPAAPVVPVPAVEIPVRQVQVNRFEIPAPGQEWVAPPQLTVSEILPPTGGERMAIVNGLPVMAGTMVDDVLVEEIHADRVVFAIGGKHVSVSLQGR